MSLPDAIRAGLTAHAFRNGLQRIRRRGNSESSKSREQVATTRIVGNLVEQDLLEHMLEDNKAGLHRFRPITRCPRPSGIRHCAR